MNNPDQIMIRNLLVRGIVGINPDERVKRQNIMVNVIMWADTRPAAASDDIKDAVNYKTISKAIIAHIKTSKPFLVERLATDLVQLCFDTDARIQAVELSLEKPGALRFAQSVGVTIYRQREDIQESA